MSRILPQVKCFVLCTAILPLAGCDLDWAKKKGDSASSIDGGGDRNGDANDGMSGREDVEANGGNDDNGAGNTGSSTGDTAGTTGDAKGPGAECGAELCNERDDDCDTVIDETCSDVDECAALPCRNGGACAEADGSFLCTCPAGFEGKTCENNIDDCAAKPCLNGGACADGDNGFTCSCAVGHQGDLCEIANNDCDPNPCRNGGSCSDTGAGVMCTCLPGFTGTQCQTNIDECAAKPCQHNGICKDGMNGYTCICPAGYEGMQCQKDIDECAAKPCLNSGVCEDRPNGFTCKCSAANTGTNCELKICGDVVIRSRQDIVANRACAEMHDLTIEGYAFTTVSEFDFPYLTKITGSLKMETPLDDERGNIVLSVTFAALQSIAGDFLFTFSPLREVHFPKLRTIGGSWSAAYVDYTVLLDFPALTTLGKEWTIFGGDSLCKVNIPNLSTVGGDLGLVAMPRVKPSDVAPLRKAVAEGGYSEGMLERLGCCYPGLAVNCGASLPDPAGPACECN